MLTWLSVSDFALIDSVEVEFRPGLNVFTGETGAGKTVMVGALGLLLGDRADSLQVRHGAEAARFSAAFDLSGAPEISSRLMEEGYLDSAESELLLSRTVSTGGKSRCTVNGRISPVSTLSYVGGMLVEVHGQNSHQALLDVATHVDYLDRYAGPAHSEAVSAYSAIYARLRELIAERRQLQSGGRGPEAEAELLEHELAVIEAASPVPGELEALEDEARRMRYAKELWEDSAAIERALAGDEPGGPVRDLLQRAAARARAMAARDASLEETAGRLESAALEVEDVASEMARYRCSIDTDPAALERVESRLSLLKDLCRRYGGTTEAVLDYASKASARLRLLREASRRASIIDREIEDQRKAMEEVDETLASARRGAASELAAEVGRELALLEMEGAVFQVEVAPRRRSDPDTGELGPKGSTSVEFLFSPVESAPPRPLARIASGGEMSRVMLALKIVLAGADRLPVLVFDEVDAGIGGETAGRVGEKLRALSGYHQVLCVTHIPQIATFADWQYLVFKRETDGSATTGVKLLDEGGRIDELCRMLGDSSGRKVTRAHARDMLRRAGEEAG